MKGMLQTGVEYERLVVALVGQLEKGSVGVDSVAKVRPQRNALGAEDSVSLNGGESARAEEGAEVPADDGADDSGEEAADGDGNALETEDGQRETTGGLRVAIGTK